MTPRKTRAARPASSRTGTKRATPYDEATKAKALAQLEAEGMAATHAATGIPKGSLGRWAKAAGLDLGAQARARTAAATEHVRARSAEVAVSTVAQLEAHLAQAGDYLVTVAGVNALAARALAQLDPEKIGRTATLGGFVYTVDDPLADGLVKLAAAIDTLPLAVRDAEGMVTRAIHDLQLLKGEATERGTLRVEFAVPRPTASTEPVPEYDTDND